VPYTNNPETTLATETTFNLTRQFALLSFLTIMFIGVVSATMLSRLFTDKILSQEAGVSQEFIDSIVKADKTWRFFMDTENAKSKEALQEFFDHMAHMPDMVRANVYGRDQKVLWSSDPELIGQLFHENDELESCLRGQLIFESGIVGKTTKEEHIHLGDDKIGLRFIETYIPIWNEDRQQTVGAVELYKVPIQLHRSITEGQRLIWISAFLGGLLLFSTLYWIVRRATRVMQSQQRQLIESKTLSMIGETASAVAHSMRNPLASIRVCAELTLTDDLAGARESAMDIINETDRLDRWARELLQFSSSQQEDAERIEVNEMVRDVLSGHQALLDRANIQLDCHLADDQLHVNANAAPLAQVVGNLITNAVEAMEENGVLQISTALEKKPPRVRITVKDTGPGLSPAIESKLFRPFSTTKSNGTGLGLALSKRLVEHYDGSIALQSVSGQGVTVTIHLPAVD